MSSLRRVFPGLLLTCMVAAAAAFPAFGAAVLNQSASASSTLYEPGYDHSAYCCMDYDLSTAWMEGANGPGYGEYMTIYTEPYAVITGGVIYPGFYMNEDMFYKNNAPTRLYIRTDNQETYLEVTEAATTYQQNFAGYRFTLDEPLISYGSVRVTIVGVRQGWKYDDTCISELRFEGYVADASSLPYIDQSHPHTSVVTGQNEYYGQYTDPDDDVYDANQDPYSEPDYYDANQDPASWPDFYLDPNGLGGDGRDPKELEGTQDAEYLDSSVVQRLTEFASALYRMHCGGTSTEMTINDGSIYSYSRAYMLNWYQSHCPDDRVTFGSGYNYGYENDLSEILDELFETTDPQEDLAALENYFAVYRNGQLFCMNPQGTAWKSGPVYLDTPSSVGDMYGRTLLMGRVMEYNSYSGSYVNTLIYYAYFVQDPDDPSVFRFDELVVG